MRGRNFLSRIEFDDHGFININFEKLTNLKTLHLFLSQLKQELFVFKIKGLNLSDCGLGLQEIIFLEPYIGKLTQLTSLNLSKNKPIMRKPTILTFLIPALLKLKQLQYFDIKVSNWDAVAPVIAALKSSQLRSLDTIYSSSISDAKIIEELQFFSNLDSLKLSVSEETATLVTACLHRCSQLQTLHLSGSLTDVGVRALAPELGKLVQLQTLHLSCGLTDTSAQTLAPALGKLVQLQTLSLSCSLTDVGVRALAPALGKLLQLQTLHLSCGLVTDTGVQALASALGKLLQLKTLHLSCGLVTDTGVQALAPVLGKLVQLQTLRLHCRPVTDTGISALAPALGKLVQLQTLRLHCRPVTDTGISALAPALGKLVQLQTLRLHCQQVTDTSMQALALELGKLVQLQTLRLHSQQVTDTGVQALAPELGKLIQLQTFSLTSPQVTGVGAIAVAKVLRTLPQLQSLSFGSIDIDGKSVLELNGILYNFQAQSLDRSRRSYRRETAADQPLFVSKLYFSMDPAMCRRLIQQTSSSELLVVKDRFGVPLVNSIIASDNLDLLKLLINRCPGVLYSEDASGNTPLHMVCELGKLEMLQFLLAKLSDGRANSAWQNY